MASGEKPMSDDALGPWLMQRVRTATGASDSRLSREREMNGRYYDAQEPKPFHAGNSKYVSQDVYDSVESMKATLLETFTGNSKPIQFAPSNEKDVEEARIATEYTSYVVFRQNPGYRVFHDVIHDGLMNRVGIAQVYWEKDVEWVEVEMPPTTTDGAQATMQSLQGLPYRHRKITRNGDGTVTVSYEKQVDRSKVIIEVVPAEEFGISPRAKDIDSAEIVYRGMRKTKSDLRKMGIEKKVLDDLWNDDQVWLDTSPEVMQRFQDVDDSSYLGLNDELQDSRKSVMVYWIFCNLDVNGDGISQLHMVLLAGGKVLQKERVNRKPFIAFAPLMRPHSFWGSSYADKIKQTQNARTILTRAVLDHTVQVTNPRFTVVRGGLVNPKELLENRIGGIVNITRDGAVQPLQTAPLNPFIFQVLGALKDDKEQNTGISSLSQGLNKDAISQQNSADMVQQMVSVSQTRQKMVARNFAYQFMQELFLLVYQLVVENENQQKILEIAGNFVQVDPESWTERKDVTVEYALGYGEADKEAEKWAKLHVGLSQIPALQMSYGPTQQFAVARKYMTASGIKDPETYLLPPDKAPKPQPDPVQQQLQQIPLREVAVKEGHLKLETQKVQTEQGRKQTEVGLKATREQHNMQAEQVKLGHQGQKTDIDQQKFQLETEKFHHEMVVDAAEIALQKQANTITASPAPKG